MVWGRMACAYLKKVGAAYLNIIADIQSNGHEITFMLTHLAYGIGAGTTVAACEPDMAFN